MQVSIDLHLGAVREDIEVVDQQHIDTVHAQPLVAVLHRPHDRIVAVVKTIIEIETTGPERLAVPRHVTRRMQQAADLGREHEFAARTLTKELPNAVLAKPKAVFWCRIEIADTAIPRGPQ